MTLTLKNRPAPRPAPAPRQQAAPPPAKPVLLPSPAPVARIPQKIAQALVRKPVVIGLRTGGHVKGTLDEVAAAGVWLVLSGAEICTRTETRVVGDLVVNAAQVGHLHADVDAIVAQSEPSSSTEASHV